MNKQIIEQNGEPAFVVIPWHAWQRLEAILEDRADAAAVRDFLENPAEGFPEKTAHTIAVERRSPLKVLREYRRMTQSAFAEAAGTSAVYLSQIERVNAPLATSSCPGSPRHCRSTRRCLSLERQEAVRRPPLGHWQIWGRPLAPAVNKHIWRQPQAPRSPQAVQKSQPSLWITA